MGNVGIAFAADFLDPGALGRAVAARRGDRGAFGIDVECYVLGDLEKTAVISQTGMARALGLSPRGNALPRFLASKAMANFVGAELCKKLENPFIFQWGTGGAGDRALLKIQTETLPNFLIASRAPSTITAVGKTYSRPILDH